MNDLRYPIGKFSYDGDLTEDRKRAFLDEIARAPAQLRARSYITYPTVI